MLKIPMMLTFRVVVERATTSGDKHIDIRAHNVSISDAGVLSLFVTYRVPCGLEKRLVASFNRKSWVTVSYLDYNPNDYDDFIENE